MDHLRSGVGRSYLRRSVLRARLVRMPGDTDVHSCTGQRHRRSTADPRVGCRSDRAARLKGRGASLPASSDLTLLYDLDCRRFRGCTTDPSGAENRLIENPCRRYGVVVRAAVPAI